MTFARLSTLYNSLVFLSACSVEDHLNPVPLVSSEIEPVQLEIIHLFGLN